MSDILNALLGVALQGAGHFVKNRAEEKAASKRNAILREMQALQTAAMDKQLAATQQAAQTYAPAQRLPALDRAEQVNVQRLQQDLVGPDTTLEGPVYGGKVSDDYVLGKARRTAADLGYATKLASLMGRVSAPADVALEQSIAGADAANARAGIRSDMGSALGTRDLALRAVEPNGGQMFAGDLLQGAGLTIGTPRNDTGFGAPTQAGGASQIPPGTPPAVRAQVGNQVPGRRTGVDRSSLNASMGRSGTPAGKPKPGSTAYWGGRR